MLPAVISLGNADVMFWGHAVIAFAHFAVFLSMWRKNSRDSGRGAPEAVSDLPEVRSGDSTGLRKPKTPGPANGGRIWKTLLPALVLALALACPACRRHATVKNLPKDMVQVCRAFRDAPVGPERVYMVDISSEVIQGHGIGIPGDQTRNSLLDEKVTQL